MRLFQIERENVNIIACDSCWGTFARHIHAQTHAVAVTKAEVRSAAYLVPLMYMYTVFVIVVCTVAVRFLNRNGVGVHPYL